MPESEPKTNVPPSIRACVGTRVGASIELVCVLCLCNPQREEGSASGPSGVLDMNFLVSVTQNV